MWFDLSGKRATLSINPPNCQMLGEKRGNVLLNLYVRGALDTLFNLPNDSAR